jgi:hypothetical protein
MAADATNRLVRLQLDEHLPRLDPLPLFHGDTSDDPLRRRGQRRLG